MSCDIVTSLPQAPGQYAVPLVMALISSAFVSEASLSREHLQVRNLEIFHKQPFRLLGLNSDVLQQVGGAPVLQLLHCGFSIACNDLWLLSKLGHLVPKALACTIMYYYANKGP